MKQIPSPRVARLGMTATFLANGLTFGAWVGCLPRLREAAGLDDAGLGILLLALGLGSVGGMPLVTVLVTRFGAPRMALAGALALLVALPLPVVVSGWAPMLAAGVLFGVLMACVDVSMNAHAVEVERQWGRAVMSSFHAAWSAGGLAGSAAMGALTAAGWSLVACLVTAAVVSAVLAVAGAWASDRRRPAATPAAAGVGWALPGRAMLGACALAVLCFVTEGAIGDWSGVYLRTVLGASVAAATNGYSVFAGTMAACRLGGDFAVRRLGPARVVQMGGVLAAAGIGLALLMPNALAAALAFALVAVGLSNIVPVVFSAAGRLGGAVGTATVATVGYAGLLAGPPVIGFVAQGFGLVAALGMVACFGVLVALLGSLVGQPTAGADRRRAHT